MIKRKHRILMIALLVISLFILIGCSETDPKPFDNNDNKDASLVILNDESIYYDELDESTLQLDVVVENATSDKVIYIIDEVKDFISVDENGFMVISTDVTNEYKFTLTAVLEVNRRKNQVIEFVVIMTRGVIVGEKQVGQVALTVNGDPSTSRGISWFSSEDVTVSEVLVATQSDFSDAVTYSGTRKSFEKYAEALDSSYGVPKQTFYNHQAVINGLTPNTRYYYKAGSKDMDLFTQVGSFKTTGVNNEVVNLFITTDTHMGSNEIPLPKNRFYHRALKDAMDRYDNIDFAVNTGDIVSQWSSSYTYFESEWAQVMNLSPLLRQTTLVPVAGNHDNKVGNSQFEYALANHYNFPDSPEMIDDGNILGPNFSFELENAHIFVLAYHERGVFPEALENWLIHDLSNSTKEWKILFTHIEVPEQIKAVLETYGVVLAYSGHEHFYKRTKPMVNNVVQNMIFDTSLQTHLLNQTGTTYITNSTPGGASSWRTYNESSNNVEGFGIGTKLDGLGSIQHRWGMYTVLTIEKNVLTAKIYIRNTTSALDEFVLYRTYGFVNK